MRKTICFADPSYFRKNVGGAEVQMMLLAQEFGRRGWEVHYVSGDIEYPCIIDGVHYHPCSGNSGTVGGYEGFLAAIEATGARVVYQRGRKSYTAYLGSIGQDLGCRTIFATSMDIDCRVLKETPRLLASLAKAPWAMKQLAGAVRLDMDTLAGMRAADIVLTQSEHQKQKAYRNLGVTSRVVHNMHPVPSVDGEKRNPPVVLWLANLKPWKRPRKFLRLVRDMDTLDCRFVMAGRIDGDERLRGEIEELQKKDERFEYLGSIPFEQTADLFRSATIFVNTSRKNEGVPNSFIQAWLARMPVLSLEVDPDEAIKRNGLGTVSGSYRALREDLRRYISNADLCKAAGDRARAFAIEKFDLDTQFPRLLSVTESLLETDNRFS